MPATACAACRDSKVKCELLQQSDGSTQACARCIRIGLICEPTQPSLRGKRSSLPRLGILNKRRLEAASSLAAKASSHADKAPAESVKAYFEWCPLVELHPSNMIEGTAEGGKFVDFWTKIASGPGLATNTRYLATQKAGRAQRFNRPDFMMAAMSLCAHYGYCVEDVVAKSKVMGSQPLNIDDFPPAMAAMLHASSGYASGRCVTSGIATSVTNAKFGASIMTSANLDSAAADPAMECPDIFGFGHSAYVHADDTHRMTKFTAGLFALERTTGTVHTGGPSPVRIADWRMRSHVPCAVRGMIHFEETLVLLAVEFVPVGPPIPFETSSSPLQMTQQPQLAQITFLGSGSEGSTEGAAEGEESTTDELDPLFSGIGDYIEAMMAPQYDAVESAAS